MKSFILKLFLISAMCVTPMFPINNTSIALSKEIQSENNKYKESNEISLSFFVFEGDILVGKTPLNKLNLTSLSNLYISDSTLSIDLVDGQVEIYGLKPNTTYSNINITLIDELNNAFTFKIKDFTTPDENFIGYSNADIAVSNGNYIAKITLPKDNIKNIQSIELSDKSISTNIIEDSIVLSNIKNNTVYSDLLITLTTNEGKKYTSKINTFKVPQKNVKSIDVKVSSYKDNYIGEILLPPSLDPQNITISDENIKLKQEDSKVILENLNPESTYSDLTLTISDKGNIIHCFKLNEFSTINKNYGYSDVELIKNGENIQGTLILPNDLKIENAKFSDTSLEFIIDKNSNKITITNLQPHTNYNSLKTIIQDNNGELHNFVINKFFTGIVDVNLDYLSSYVRNAYEKAFDRKDIDEDGFNYWLEKLSNSRVSSREFILNILNSKEFLSVTKSSHDKITRIYGVMYNRIPDIDGLNFWITEYENDLKFTNDERSSILHIVKRMMDEQEFKNIISSIGIRY